MNPQDQAPLATPVPVNPHALVGPVELLSHSWAFFAKHWKLLLSISVITFASIIVALILFGASFTLHNTVVTVICAILYFVTLFSAVALYPALINAIHRLNTEPDQKLTISGQYKYGFKVCGSFFVLMLIVGLVTYGSLALFVIPGIAVVIYTAFNFFTFVVDGKKGFAALIESYRLVKGRWWHVLGRILFFALVATGALIILEMAIFFISFLLGLILPPIFIAFILPIVLILFEAALIVFGLIYLYQLYMSLKATQSDVVEVKNIKPWLVAFFVFGILVVIAYVGIIIASVFTGFGQTRQNDYRTQINSPEFQSQLQELIRQAASTTPSVQIKK